MNRWPIVLIGLFLTGLGADIVGNAQIFKPPKEGKPDNSSGAGSRSEQKCPGDTVSNPPFTAIVPRDTVGLTVAAYPRFWVYIPPTSAKRAVLTLQRKTYQVQSSVNLTGKGEIVGLTAKETAPPLEIGQTYQWAVVLVCGDQPSPNDPVVKAQVRRVSLSTPAPLGDQLTVAEWYGERGIWYDTLNALAESPKSESWLELLNSVGLGQIATQPRHY